MFDFSKIRNEFPMLNGKTMQGHKLVFLDNASTTFKPYAVINEMNRYYIELTSNSHRGDYDLCYNMDVEIATARKNIAKFINSNEDEVIFTSGDTEALNAIAYGFALKNLNENDAILISESEHASNVLPWYRISEVNHCKVVFVKNTNGRIEVSDIENAFIEHPNIKLVSLAHISNVLGYKIDAKNICKVAHSHGALVVLDGAQSVPHTKVDFKELNCDFLTFSAHKMCGPTGIGALVVKRNLIDLMDCFLTGGGMNITFKNDGSYEPLCGPAKFEAGTLNLSGIMGFNKAIEFINDIGIENIEKREKELHNYLLNKLQNCNNIIIYNKDSDSAILTFNVKGIFSQDEATLLNSKGIAVRSGQHCAKMIDGVIDTNATVRASLYFYTSEEEIDIFVDALINGGDILDAYFK